MRKGAMSLCSCIPGSVPPAEVHLRPGHSFGNTHGRYIFGSAGGDEMAGRVLAGGNLHRTSFAALPSHFRNDFYVLPFSSKLCPQKCNINNSTSYVR